MNKEKDVSKTPQAEEESKTKKYLRLAFSYIVGAFFLALVVALVLRKCGT